MRKDIPYSNVAIVPAADHLLKHFTLNRNHNSESHATSVKVMALQKLLEGYPNRKYIVDCFTHGFDLNNQGNNNPLCSNNSALALSNIAAAEEKSAQEISLKFIAGPFIAPF